MGFIFHKIHTYILGWKLRNKTTPGLLQNGLNCEVVLFLRLPKTENAVWEVVFRLSEAVSIRRWLETETQTY